jgi:hypothetical protein
MARASPYRLCCPLSVQMILTIKGLGFSCQVSECALLTTSPSG